MFVRWDHTMLKITSDVNITKHQIVSYSMDNCVLVLPHTASPG